VANGLQGTTALNDGTWRYVAMTVNKSTNTITFYVNGTADGSLTHASVAVDHTTTAPVYIGADRTAGNFLNGSIPIVQIYNRALSSQEIKQNCIAQQSRFGVSTCAAP
ncbi:MAG: LamG domain-containing protein, partial [Bdellovibrionia bacterium]